MKKKLSNKTFFTINRTAPLEGDEMIRPASPNACLSPAAHKVSTKGKCGAPWSPPPIENKPKALIINYLSTNVMLKKNESFRKTTDCD